MAIDNAMLAGGAALSLLAGVFAGQYALLPAHGGREAQEMTPLRFPAAATAEAESPWREARYAPPPTSPPRAVETVDLTADDSVPPDPPAAEETPPTAVQASDPDAEPPAPADPQVQPAGPPQDAPGA